MQDKTNKNIEIQKQALNSYLELNKKTKELDKTKNNMITSLSERVEFQEYIYYELIDFLSINSDME